MKNLIKYTVGLPAILILVSMVLVWGIISLLGGIITAILDGDCDIIEYRIENIKKRIKIICEPIED